jgi:hypothetical protein
LTVRAVKLSDRVFDSLHTRESDVTNKRSDNGPAVVAGTEKRGGGSLQRSR